MKKISFKKKALFLWFISMIILLFFILVIFIIKYFLNFKNVDIIIYIIAIGLTLWMSCFLVDRYLVKSKLLITFYYFLTIINFSFFYFISSAMFYSI